MIEVRNVCYQYPKSDFKIDNLSITFNNKECVALQGENGSGKTTIAKLIAGVLRPDSGDIFIDGQSTVQMSLGKIGSKVGFLFQEPSRQLFAVTVEEELTFAQVIKGESEQEAKANAVRLLQSFDMENMLRRNVQTLSRGEKQRLAICALICCKPELFILDEPTSGLDEEAVEKLSQTLGKLSDSGAGVVLISHDKEFVKRHVTRRITVQGGVCYEK